MEEFLDIETLSKNSLQMQEPLKVGDLRLSAAEIVHMLSEHLTTERIERLDQVIKGRSFHFASILENIYDRGNISAVMRSSEAFGFLPIHIVEAEGKKFKAANRVTKGSEKWLDVHLHRSPQACVTQLKRQGFKIYATHLDAEMTISELDFSEPIAVVFGNEKDGTSPEMMSLCDGHFKIPMLGFSQSFNISVAAALTFYHVHLEQVRLGIEKTRLSPQQMEVLRANYYLRCFEHPEKILQAKIL